MVKILIEERFGRYVVTGNLKGDYFRYEVEEIDGVQQVYAGTYHQPLEENEVLLILNTILQWQH